MQLEAGPAPPGGVDDQQVAVLAEGELAGDVEAEPDPAGPALDMALELGEAVEDVLALGLGNAGAGVLDGQDGLGALPGP